MAKTRYITITAMGIALYAVLSMTAKIPLIGHISLDLGYIVLAIYCYHMGVGSGSIVGGAGCVIISMLTTGWFPTGWMIGNIVIAIICGAMYRRDGMNMSVVHNIVTSILAVAVGILVLKTVIECALYGIPLAVKIPKNAVAFVTDAIVMSIGCVLAQRGPIAGLCIEHIY